jgi:DNA-binding GntR family transcriptional regulator
MLREQIKDELLRRILEGDYSPGERIVETRVAQEFGVSQAPVREALRELESLRLVNSEPHRGVRVREVTTEELLEIYPVRAALEEVAARDATRNLKGDVSALAEELDAMLEAAAAGDFNQHVVHDVRFHRLIVEASGNRTLQELWDSLRVHARTAITLTGVDDLQAVAESHRPVLEAIQSGRPAEAGKVLRRHIEAFAKLVEHPEQKHSPGAGLQVQD